MTQDIPNAPAPSRGAGVLLHTDTERVPLGTHAGRRLTAHVEHRTLRVVLGRWWHGSLTLGRRRAVAIEVEPSDQCNASSTPGTGLPRYDEVAVPAPVDPWVRYARRTAAVALGGWLLTTVVSRARRRTRERATGQPMQE